MIADSGADLKMSEYTNPDVVSALRGGGIEITYDTKCLKPIYSNNTSDLNQFAIGISKECIKDDSNISDNVDYTTKLEGETEEQYMIRSCRSHNTNIAIIT